jgi:magnesium and cobalt transporter
MSNDESSSSKNNNHKTIHNIIKIIKRLFNRNKTSLAESVTALLEKQSMHIDINEEEQSMLLNVVNFKELEASDVMIPRTDIVAVSLGNSLNKLKKIFIKEVHTRLPVYKNDIDEIEGFIHLKDFFKYFSSGKKFEVSQIVREIIFVPETIKISNLLTKMKQSATHMAIVLNEYGGTKGLITIEDIIEKLVGEIKDEYDDQDVNTTLIKSDGDGYIIEAKTEIYVFEKYFGIDVSFGINDPQYDTVGGMVITYLGIIPKTGEVFDHPKGFTVEILEADSRRVKSIRIKGIEPDAI